MTDATDRKRSSWNPGETFDKALDTEEDRAREEKDKATEETDPATKGE